MIADSADSNKLKKITYNHLKGAQGDPGVSIVWRWAYSGGTAYVINDAVSYNGSAYICKLASTGNLPTNATYWDVILTSTAATTTSLGAGEIATSAESIAGTNTGSVWPLRVQPSDVAANTQSGVFTYAADAQASDTYVISLTPALTAYTTGMAVRAKFNTVNTGACTLNVNSLWAKAIKTAAGVDPSNGLIPAGWVFTLIYDGTDFRLPLNNPQTLPTMVADVVNISQAANSNTSIAYNHSLGVVPKLITFGAYLGNVGHSYGGFDGTDNYCSYLRDGAATQWQSTTRSIFHEETPGVSGGGSVTAVSSTTFTITWASAGGPGGTFQATATLIGLT